MSHSYKAVSWNRQKRIYDLTLWAGIILYLGVFIGAGFALHPNVTLETLLIRGLASAAFILLHIILIIGPLCRLSSRFLPLLYNRRHMGVSMFLLALAHSIFSIIQFHTLGDVNPLISLLTGNGDYNSLSQFPFQALGFAALIILLFMAATSHDYWLKNLTPPIWKSLHMMVYVAYCLIFLHVVLGIMQVENHPIFIVLMAAGFILVVGLHLISAINGCHIDGFVDPSPEPGYTEVCHVDDIPENRAHIAFIADERVAIFKHDGKISAVSNVCQHQNGPLGEGQIIDGLITCPWHGFQYCPRTGKSPEPYDEKIPTFDVKVVDGNVLVSNLPNPAGTAVEPALI